MDLFNKIKAKIVEESESERDEPTTTTSSSSSRRADMRKDERISLLESELTQMKEHINNNFYIYKRRLEKRKERIKELEEYAKLLIQDNETLQEKQRSFADCQKQLGETRENLEQLEGFQNQELAKVKHMLLSAETTLEQERRQKEKLLQQQRQEEEEERKTTTNGEVEDLKEQMRLRHEEGDVRMRELAQDHEQVVRRLEERIRTQDLGGDERLQAVISERDELEESLRKSRAEVDSLKSSSSVASGDLESKNSRLQAELAEGRRKLVAVAAERDALKGSLLEMEISSHESQTNLGSEREKVRMDVARLGTEKETLEVTLELRDKELKAKKEEFRKEMDNLTLTNEELKKEIDAKSSKVSALEAERALLLSTLSEERRKCEQASEVRERLDSEVRGNEVSINEKAKTIASLTERMQDSQKEAADLSAQALRLHGDLDEMSNRCHELSRQLEDANLAKDALSSEMAEAKVERQRLEQMVRTLEEKMAHSESTFDVRVEQTETVQRMRRNLQAAEDELTDKRKMVKLHQQRITDMKKTFQKELKSTTGSSNHDEVNGFASSFSSSVERQASPGPFEISYASSSGFGGADASAFFTAGPGEPHIVTMTEVNFKYLKHVIFKFFTSPDYEAKHLTRAISALLKLSSDEERLLQDHLEWKMSWFGSRPRLGGGQFSFSIEPS